MKLAMLSFAAVQFAIALFQVVAPHAFFDSLGPFDRFNPHYMQDTAAFGAALGVGLAAAASRPSWRPPVLIVATAHYALHAISHLVDIGDSDPGWVGYFDFASVAGGAVLLAGLTVRALREERALR